MELGAAVAANSNLTGRSTAHQANPASVERFAQSPLTYATTPAYPSPAASSLKFASSANGLRNFLGRVQSAGTLLAGGTFGSGHVRKNTPPDAPGARRLRSLSVRR
jgi:hypothetical protein